MGWFRKFKGWETFKFARARWAEVDGDQRAAAFYKLAQSRPTRFTEVWLAALGATVLIQTGGLLFLLQAAHLGRFNVLCGALGSVVAFLLWVYGYNGSFNPTFPALPKHEYGWVSPYHFGIEQGPIVLMIENHRSGLLWSLMRQCPYLVTGLRRAGFTGGWLE